MCSWLSLQSPFPSAGKSTSVRPFAQLLPGLETGHPVTVGQSPTCSFSVSDGREVLFLSPFRAVLSAIHVFFFFFFFFFFFLCAGD